MKCRSVYKACYICLWTKRDYFWVAIQHFYPNLDAGCSQFAADTKPGVLSTAWMAALGNKEQQEVQQTGNAGCCAWDAATMSGWRAAGQKGSWGGWWQQAQHSLQLSHRSLQLPKQGKCKRKVLVTAPSLLVTGRRVTAHSCTRGGSDWTLENVSLP